jgi:hypothetical protein
MIAKLSGKKDQNQGLSVTQICRDMSRGETVVQC